MKDETSLTTGIRIHIGPIGTNRGISFTAPFEPTCDKEWVLILKEVIGMLDANDLPDPEVLGKYSPLSKKEMRIMEDTHGE